MVELAFRVATVTARLLLLEVIDDGVAASSGKTALTVTEFEPRFVTVTFWPVACAAKH